MSKPNLFNFATSELSQDAFICWLAEWANDKYKDPDSRLSECGKEFVRRLIQKKSDTFNENINSTIVWRQSTWENNSKIDICITVNDKHFIVVEDKIHALEHGNQLDRYKEIAEKHCKDKNQELHLIYLKTGSECGQLVKNATDKGYSVFYRENFLSLLREFKDIGNNIFTDFREKLEAIEAAELAFAEKSIKDWGSFGWIGFYKTLEKKIGRPIWWSYVPNPSGGFLCAVVAEYPTAYLQIEQNELCFKIRIPSLEPGQNRSQLRNETCWSFIKFAHERGAKEIHKPKHFGKGATMTFCEVGEKDWLGEKCETISFDRVLERLMAYSTLLKDFADSNGAKLQI